MMLLLIIPIICFLLFIRSNEQLMRIKFSIICMNVDFAKGKDESEIDSNEYKLSLGKMLSRRYNLDNFRVIDHFKKHQSYDEMVSKYEYTAAIKKRYGKTCLALAVIYGLAIWIANYYSPPITD